MQHCTSRIRFSQIYSAVLHLVVKVLPMLLSASPGKQA